MTVYRQKDGIMKMVKIISCLILMGCFCLQSFAMNFELTSTSFPANGIIPERYTCHGLNISPQLSWRNAPVNTQSFVLIMLDPDASKPNWAHWVLFNIPSNTNTFDENASLPIEAMSGLNSWRTSGYVGPCPPSGTHRYSLRLYALDTVLQLSNKAQSTDVNNAMRGHILGEAVLMGRVTSTRQPSEDW
jgi:hypothetical protein